MAYSLTIERPTKPIILEEWREAIGSVEGIRLTPVETHTVQNHASGEIIGIRASRGDAQILNTEDGQWRSAFVWRDEEGAAHFNARIIDKAANSNELTYSAWVSLSSVAKLLLPKSLEKKVNYMISIPHSQNKGTTG